MDNIDETNKRYSTVVNPDEVLIVIHKNENSTVDFTIIVQEDAVDVADIKVLSAVAAGMITIASKQLDLCVAMGQRVLDAAEDIEEATQSGEG